MEVRTLFRRELYREYHSRIDLDSAKVPLKLQGYLLAYRNNGAKPVEEVLRQILSPWKLCLDLSWSIPAETLVLTAEYSQNKYRCYGPSDVKEPIMSHYLRNYYTKRTKTTYQCHIRKL